MQNCANRTCEHTTVVHWIRTGANAKGPLVLNQLTLQRVSWHTGKEGKDRKAEKKKGSFPVNIEYPVPDKFKLKKMKTGYTQYHYRGNLLSELINDLKKIETQEDGKNN